MFDFCNQSLSFGIHGWNWSRWKSWQWIWLVDSCVVRWLDSHSTFTIFSSCIELFFNIPKLHNIILTFTWVKSNLFSHFICQPLSDILLRQNLGWTKMISLLLRNDRLLVGWLHINLILGFAKWNLGVLDWKSKSLFYSLGWSFGWSSRLFCCQKPRLMTSLTHSQSRFLIL